MSERRLRRKLAEQELRRSELANIQTAMDMTSPMALLQQAQQAASLTGSLQNQSFAEDLHPLNLIRQGLMNEAQTQTNAINAPRAENADSLFAMQQQQGQAQLDQAELANQMAQLNLDDYQTNQDFDRSMQERELALREAGIESANNNTVAGLLRTAGDYGDITDVIQQYFQQQGIPGEFSPFPQITGLGGGPTPEQQAMMEKLNQALQLLNER